MFPLFLGYLFIFCARVVDVSLSTIRMLMLVRGQKIQASVIGFFEVMVYIVALNRVVGQLDNICNLIAYCLGFATGNYVGILIEEKLALGLTTVQINTRDLCLCEFLRNKGYGVTVIEGMGKEGPRQILTVSTPRKTLPNLLNLIEKQDDMAFVTIMDTKATRGGYFKKVYKAK